MLESWGQPREDMFHLRPNGRSPRGGAPVRVVTDGRLPMVTLAPLNIEDDDEEEEEEEEEEVIEEKNDDTSPFITGRTILP